MEPDLHLYLLARSLPVCNPPELHQPQVHSVGFYSSVSSTVDSELVVGIAYDRATAKELGRI